MNYSAPQSLTPNQRALRAEASRIAACGSGAEAAFASELLRRIDPQTRSPTNPGLYGYPAETAAVAASEDPDCPF